MSAAAELELLRLLKKHGVRRGFRPVVLIGRWFVYHYRRNAKRKGYGRAARQLKKQGVPFVLARLLLFGRF